MRLNQIFLFRMKNKNKNIFDVVYFVYLEDQLVNLLFLHFPAETTMKSKSQTKPLEKYLTHVLSHIQYSRTEECIKEIFRCYELVEFPVTPESKINQCHYFKWIVSNQRIVTTTVDLVIIRKLVLLVLVWTHVCRLNKSESDNYVECISWVSSITALKAIKHKTATELSGIKAKYDWQKQLRLPMFLSRTEYRSPRSLHTVRAGNVS